MSKPFTRMQLEEALHAAILGLRSLDGMAGTVEKRRTLIRQIGYQLGEYLGMGDVGYHPLDVIERRLEGK